MDNRRIFRAALIVFLFIGPLSFSLITYTKAEQDPSETFSTDELSSSHVNSKSEWYRNAFEALKSGRYPRIKSESIWSESWENAMFLPDSELQIDSSDETLQVYREEISSDIFKTHPKWILRPGSSEGSGDEDNALDYVLAPPDTGIYHNAYPDFEDTEDKVTREAIESFIRLSGKDVMYIYFSNHWLDHIEFPRDSVEIIHNMGFVPYIRMMPWSEIELDRNESIYTMQNIIDEEFDENITQWAVEAGSLGYPIILEFGVEVNGPWFPWNGIWNGGGKTDGYGDPTVPDGPERFRDAYRHIIEIFWENNVKNITWVYHVDSDIDKEHLWNNLSAYYPGDEYIDWIGISVYGPLNYDEEWVSFTQIMDDVYPELCNISQNKALALLEFGADENADSRNKVYLFLYGTPIAIIFMVGLISLFVYRRYKRKGLR